MQQGSATIEVTDEGEVLRLLGAANAAAQALAHGGYERRCAGALTRLQRPGAVIAVAGEYKQGKSSLVNGLLGANICRVDDDIATTRLTLLQHGEQFQVTTWRIASGEFTATLEDADWLQHSPSGAVENGHDSIRLVQVSLPNALLSAGVSLVDTPGVGGLDPAYGELTLSYLQTVHAMLFVTTAGKPLSLGEMQFLKQALVECDRAIIVMTRIDLHARWRDVAAMNETILRDAGLDLPILAVSNSLRSAALELADAELNDESGYALLLGSIQERFLASGRLAEERHALGLARDVFHELRRRLSQEVEARLAPELGAERIWELTESRRRLELLREGGSRWQTILNDGFSDLQADVDYRYRSRIRDISRSVDEQIEDSDPLATWDDISASARQRVSEAARTMVRDFEAGSDLISRKIVSSLADEGLGLEPLLGTAATVNVDGYRLRHETVATGLGSAAGTGLTALRGAQGGLLLLGMMTSLTGIVVSGGMLLGVAAIFGGKSFIEDRRKQVMQRRQAARAAFRQFVDDAQFEIARTTRELTRDLQRRLRTHFGECISEAIRSCSTQAEGLAAAIKEDTTTRERAIAAGRQQIEQLDDLLARAGRAEAALLG